MDDSWISLHVWRENSRFDNRTLLMWSAMGSTQVLLRMGMLRKLVRFRTRTLLPGLDQ